MIKGYATTKPGGTLQPFEFDPGPLGDNHSRTRDCRHRSGHGPPRRGINDRTN